MKYSLNEARVLFHSDRTTELAYERGDGDGQQLARSGPRMYRCWLPLCHCHRLVHTHRAVGVVDAVGRAGRWRRSKNRSDADNFARHGCAMFGKRCLDALIDKGREPVARAFSSSLTTALRLTMILLKQRAQFERRPGVAASQDRRDHKQLSKILSFPVSREA